MNEERFVLTADVLLRLAPHMPGKQGDAGVTGKDNRLFLKAVLWRVRTGLTILNTSYDFPGLSVSHASFDLPVRI